MSKSWRIIHVLLNREIQGICEIRLSDVTQSFCAAMDASVAFDESITGSRSAHRLVTPPPFDHISRDVAQSNEVIVPQNYYDVDVLCFIFCHCAGCCVVYL